MYSDEQYDYYGSKMNKPIQNRTLIIARDSNGKITFKSESKGKLPRPAYEKILAIPKKKKSKCITSKAIQLWK